MDNVLGLGLLGVICCLYHQLWRAETERERENERNWQRAADSESRTSPHYSQILLGVDQSGAIRSLNFKEFHCLVSSTISLYFNNKERQRHTCTFSQNTHTRRPISGLWELIIFPDERCHELPGRSPATVSLCDVGFKCTACGDSWVGGDTKSRQRLTQGGSGLVFGASRGVSVEVLMIHLLGKFWNVYSDIGKQH